MTAIEQLLTGSNLRYQTLIHEKFRTKGDNQNLAGRNLAFNILTTKIILLLKKQNQCLISN